MQLYNKTASQLRKLLDDREISSVELVQDVLNRIQSLDGKMNAYVTVRADVALAEAQAADERIAKGEDVRPLTGIPVSLKDNMCVEGAPTTCSSKILKEFVPPYDATVTALLKRAGAPILGSLNMDEFAMGSSTENSAYGVTRNPWDFERVPGGSSGGSAAAIAADTAVLALGSDTGGSIRQPAAFCGVVGVKPTYGLVSRFGLIAFASSLDQIGPIAKTVEDSAMLLQVIAGGDPCDSTSIHEETPDFTRALNGGVKDLVIGLPQEYFGEGIDPEVGEAVRKAVRVLESQGAQVKEISMPHSEQALAVYYMIAPAEASSNLARYDGVRYGHRTEGANDVTSMFRETRREGFGPEVKRRIMLGTYALSAGYYDAYYLKALKVRTLIRKDFDDAFAECDLLAAPTTPTTAFRIGEKAEDPLQMYQSDICTVTANLAGVPALSVPCGLDSRGLPIGLQLFGPTLSEALLLRTAYTYEQAAGLGGTLKPQLEVV